MVRYAIVIEKGQDNYGAYVPDLPGCVGTGDTLEEMRREIAEAIAFHIEGLRADGLPVPEARRPTASGRDQWSPVRRFGGSAGGCSKGSSLR